MAFKRYGGLNHKLLRELQSLPVANGSSLTEGMALTIAYNTGRISKMTAGAVFLGILDHAPETLTGNAGGTVVADSISLDPGSTYLVPQGTVLSDALSAVGCLIDISSDGLGVTTYSSGDFRVLERITINSTKYLIVVPVSRAYP